MLWDTQGEMTMGQLEAAAGPHAQMLLETTYNVEGRGNNKVSVHRGQQLLHFGVVRAKTGPGLSKGEGE